MAAPTAATSGPRFPGPLCPPSPGASARATPWSRRPTTPRRLVNATASAPSGSATEPTHRVAVHGTSRTGTPLAASAPASSRLSSGSRVRTTAGPGG
ncbi:MAG: hypothetical protein HY815_21860 [Candidatus Riflebacteria bacterium]|nr:hypothetical protein [Candidatus Riflebacteria bacterium]